MISKVVVNGITFSNDGSSPFWFNKVDGLASATYRNTVIIYSDRNGASVPLQRKGQKIVSLHGGLDEDSCNDHLQARKDLLNALGFNEWKPVDFYLSDGRILRNYAKFDTPELPVEALTYSNFMLVMMMRYNDFDDVTGGADANSVEVRKAVSGGWVQENPDGWVQYHDVGWVQEQGMGAVNAVDSGTTVAYPVIYIRGAVQNPTLINQSTGQLFKVNITTTSTDVIKIDTRQQATTLNGGNINALVDPSSTYFALQTGDNLLEFQSTAGDGFAEVTWFSMVGGV